MSDFDVLIAGAGPAGAATAISLVDFAPNLKVALADVLQKDELPVGETLPPRAGRLLEHLGAWDAFAADGHRPSYRTVSAWGGPELLANEFIFQVDQTGWRIDRARFDAMLLAKAASRTTQIAARVSEIAREGEWCVRFDNGTDVNARFLVDATGRGAMLARAQGAQFENLDRLAGSVVLFEGVADDGTGLLVETFADGWWYTAALPAGRRIVACMSDADLMRSFGVNEMGGFMRALGDTRHVRRTIADAHPLGSPALRPAGSRRMTRDTTLPLLCVGDAASCFDPVSGQGIFKALRSGIFASYAIANFLLRADDAGLKRFRRLVKDDFASYNKTLLDYYARERRWADRAFWRRRIESETSVSADAHNS